MITGHWRREWNDNETACLLGLRAQGLSLSEIAAYLGRSRSSVSNKICRTGAIFAPHEVAQRQVHVAVVC